MFWRGLEGEKWVELKRFEDLVGKGGEEKLIMGWLLLLV